jgi:cytochrome-b5 reductase
MFQAISPKADKTFKLRAINYLTHDTNVYIFEISDSTKKLDLPLGHHICLYVMIDGERMKRSYTPIVDKPGSFELLVKTYQTRKVSEEMSHMRVGDHVYARGPFGHFRYDPDAKYTRICMYAAGTGITPHYQILAHAAKKKSVWSDSVSLL